MNKTLTISFLLLSGWFSVFVPTNTQARLTVIDFKKNSLLQTGCWTKITKEEMELLLKDANPFMLKLLADDAELRKQQIKNIAELLAVACQAVKEGLADDDKNKQELENIRVEITSVNYDREKNQDKAIVSPFGNISEEQVKKFYANESNQTEFEFFFKVKIALIKESGQIGINIEPTEEEITQAKDYFAKTRIYYEEAKTKSGELSKEFWDKIEISVKLQQASYLSRLYTRQVLDNKTKVADEEVRDYIQKHPEFDTRVKRAKAYEILRRVEAGENFATLAKEFSDDPGSKDKGGLYENVKVGMFIPEFERAALSLKPGQIYPNIVETTYGFHIIKLLRTGENKDLQTGQVKPSYDVRHILISTGVDGTTNLSGRAIPVKEYVANKLKEEKEKIILGEILVNNPIEIAADFEIPKVSDEEMEKAQQQQMEISSVQLEADAAVSSEGIATVSVERNTIETAGQTLPPKVEAYLNSKYRGWKLSPSEKDCGVETNNGVIKGNFNADAIRDYAVKFTQGEKGYIVVFLARNQDYKAFVLHNTDAEEVGYMSLHIWEKGEIFESEGKRFRLKYDAPADYRCESDVGGIHYYQNGKFVAY